MMSAAHARHQTHTIRLGARRDGTIVGLADRIWLDLGAYNVWGIVLPYNTVAHLIGPHRIKSMRVDVRGVVTNRSEEHTSELQSPCNLVCRLLLEKKKKALSSHTPPPPYTRATHVSDPS